MNYNERIGDNFLKADHVDGEVLQHTDLNELESVVKTAINANYTDIQKLQDGTLSVANAASLIGTDSVATLSQFIDESLRESDNKIPTSMQVKKYVDNLISLRQFRGINISLSGDYSGVLPIELEITDADAKSIMSETININNNYCLATINVNGNKNFIGCLTAISYSDYNKEYYSQISLVGVGYENNLHITINLHLTKSDDANWVKDAEYSKIRISV